MGDIFLCSDPNLNTNEQVLQLRRCTRRGERDLETGSAHGGAATSSRPSVELPGQYSRLPVTTQTKSRRPAGTHPRRYSIQAGQVAPSA